MIQAAPLHIAQITDTHLFATPDREMMGVRTAKTFQAVVERLQQLQPRPDALLLTGDLSQDETPESYSYLAAAIAPLGIPAYWLPGNHDCLPVMERILNQPPISPAKSFQLGNWQFLLLSTAQPGCVHGVLSPESLQWLEEQLQQVSDRPTLIALHHHPVSIHSEWMDAINLSNSEEFLAVIHRYPQIKLVLFGHIHQEFNEQQGGITYLGTPSTCIQFMPQNRTLVIDTCSAGFRLLTLYPDGTFQTQVERASVTVED